MAVLEAFALGIPVVSTAVGGMKEIIENEISGLLVPPDNADELANAVHRLAVDPVLRRQIALGARTRLDREFSIDRMRDEVIQLYDELMSTVRT